MTAMTIDDVEYDVRYRQVPGYYNRSKYEVDVDGQHIGAVRKIRDGN